MGRKRNGVPGSSAAAQARRELHIFINLTIGIALIIIGGFFTLKNRIREVPKWINTGPAIFIACDKPLCGVEILVSTEENGTTTLQIREESADKILSVLFPHTDEGEAQSEGGENKEKTQNEQAAVLSQEEHNLWIRLVSSTDAPINWTIREQPGNVKNYELIESVPGNKHSFLARETNKSIGSSMETAFKITYGAEHFGLVEIAISEDSDHAAFHGNGIYRPRLPIVSPWQGYEQSVNYEEIYAEFIKRNRDISDPDSVQLSINNCQMYFPVLKIITSYASLSLALQHDLEPILTVPEPNNMYPLISWTQYVCSSVAIQFRDKTWEKNANRNNLLGGISVGLGVNVLLTFTNLHLIKKKKR